MKISKSSSCLPHPNLSKLEFQEREITPIRRERPASITFLSNKTIQNLFWDTYIFNLTGSICYIYKYSTLWLAVGIQNDWKDSRSLSHRSLYFIKQDNILLFYCFVFIDIYIDTLSTLPKTYKQVFVNFSVLPLHYHSAVVFKNLERANMRGKKCLCDLCLLNCQLIPRLQSQFLSSQIIHFSVFCQSNDLPQT